MDVETRVLEMAQTAKDAARRMATASGAVKNGFLMLLAELLEAERGAIVEANRKDLDAAEAAGLDPWRTDKLRLTDAVIDEMAQACRDVAGQDDPVGKIESMVKRPNGLMVGRMRVPLGVVAMIYESRPNVTVDASILCLKAGNGVFLRGGSEAIHSNLALAGLIKRALAETGLPEGALQLMETTDRAAVSAMLKLDDLIDVIIPRGGEGLIRAVVEQATMPVLKHYSGVCHAYVDKEVDLEQALGIVHNAKVQRPGVCNALEGLLVHQDVAATFLPMVAERLGGEGVELRADGRSLEHLGKGAVPAKDDDWGQEFHALILAVKTVTDMAEAQDHIARYGSNHTEIICTTNHDRAMRFTSEVDASMVGVNCSSRFNDGGQLGLGAEIGISTSKLHSYGPMGVTELTGTKFVVLGQGQVRT
jgi:glutamate-5-semialdehyde dehydrogenase